MADLLVILGFAISVVAATLKMQVNTHIRLTIIEKWIEGEGGRADKALAVLDSVGTALARVTTLYEELSHRVDRMDARLLGHERRE